MSDLGHRYRFSPPLGGWPTFDDDGHRIDDTHQSYHEPVTLTKVVQRKTRTVYYRAACACGWEFPTWRRTRKRADFDYETHASA
jgi:hypothetical protein